MKKIIKKSVKKNLFSIYFSPKLKIKKNVMQLLLKKKKKNLSFFDLKKININKYYLNMKVLKKRSFRLKQRSNLIWNDVLNFLRLNLNLVLKSKVKGQLNLEFLLFSYIYSYNNKLLKLKSFRKFKKSKKSKRRKQFFVFKYKNFFINKYFIIKKRNFLLVLDFFFKKLNIIDSLNYDKFFSYLRNYLDENNNWKKDLLLDKSYFLFLCEKKHNSLAQKIKQYSKRVNYLGYKRYIKKKRKSIFARYIYFKVKRRKKLILRKRYITYRQRKKFRRIYKLKTVMKELALLGQKRDYFKGKELTYFFNNSKLGVNTYFINIWKKKIIESTYRWRLKDYLFLFFFNSMYYGSLKKKNFLLFYYYNWFNILKINLVSLKSIVVKINNLFKILNSKILKFNTFSLKLNIKKINSLFFYRNKYKFFINLLQYYNKFFSFLLTKLKINSKLIEKKTFVLSSFLLNIVDVSKKLASVSINKYFLSNSIYSKKLALFYKDRLFNKVDVEFLDDKYSELFVNSSIIKRHKMSSNKIGFRIFGASKENLFFINKNKSRFDINVFLLYFLFYYIINFFFIYKKELKKLVLISNEFNFITINNYILTLNNVNFVFLQLNSNLKIYLINLFYNFNKKFLKESFRFFLVISLLNFFKKFYLRVNFLKLKFFILFFLIRYNLIWNVGLILFSLKKSSSIDKFNIVLNFFKNNNKVLLSKLQNNKNILDVNNYLVNKNLKKKYSFFKQLRKNKLYSNYSRYNKNNEKKCVLHYIEKKTNVFLVLSYFKKRSVIAHSSGGQGLDRDYGNSKRQKKGTRALVKVLELKFRKKVRKNKLKNLYVRAQGVWNYRINFLTKYWVLRYKLGIRYYRGMQICYKLPHHKGLKKSNKRRK